MATSEDDTEDGGADKNRGTKDAEAEKVLPQGNLRLKPISCLRHWKNQFFLSLAFLLNYTAYSSIQNIQSTVNVTRALGLTSLIVIYGFQILSSLVAPFFVGKQGAKWTLVFSMLIYVLYSYVNSFSSYYLIIIASGLLGLAGSPLWVAQATYLTRSAYQLANLKAHPEELVINWMNGLFYIFYFGANIIGNLITYFVLSSEDVEYTAAPLDTSSCGASNCGVGVGSSLPPPTPEMTQRLFAIFTSVGVAAVIALLFGVDDQQVVKGSRKNDIGIWTYGQNVFQLITDIRMSLLMPILVFHGLQEAAMFGDFTKAYVACSQGVAYIGLVLTSYGVSSSLFGLVFGQLEKVTDRMLRITFGFFTHIGLLIWLYLWQPSQGQIWPLAATASVWGMCTVVWRSQMACLLGVVFPSQHEPAFSIMVMTQGVGWVFGLMLATVSNFCVGERLIFLAGFLIVAFGLYLVSEYKCRLPLNRSKTNPEDGICLKIYDPHTGDVAVGIVNETVTDYATTSAEM